MSDTYNGWTNKETWLVNIWYLDAMQYAFSEGPVSVEALEETVKDYANLDAGYDFHDWLPAGLLSDFINTYWAEVNWHELADHLNETLVAVRSERMKEIEGED
jgi:uncharacterized protein CbrC (UPF0167 family)